MTDEKMKLEQYQKLIMEKCRIKLPVEPTSKALKLVQKIGETNDLAKIMVLCDLLTDELGGIDTEGFKIK